MKKILLMIMAVMLVFGLVGCDSDDVVIETDKTPAIDVVWEDDEIYAMALLGYSGAFGEGELDEAIDGYLELYAPELSAVDIHRVDATGDENYLVIPRFDGTVTISALGMPSESGEAEVGEVLDQFEAQAFVITCNVSDIYGNALISVEADGEVATFEPRISLMDGSLIVSDDGQDITKYFVNE